MSITVSSEVEKLLPLPASPQYDMPWEEWRNTIQQPLPEWLDAQQFIAETVFTAAFPLIVDYARQSFLPGRTMFEATYSLMQRIYHEFEFKPGFTTISTPLSAVMKAGKGVCQDFAHLAIACIRSLGLPARYISGYLETLPPPGKEKLSGADASHAWFSVFMPGQGWVDFDPTNNQLPGQQHITCCWGRDYADITPLKGVIINSGSHSLAVSVDVKRID